MCCTKSPFTIRFGKNRAIPNLIVNDQLDTSCSVQSSFGETNHHSSGKAANLF